MKKLFRGWTAFEIIFLFVSLATIIVCFFLGNDKNYLSLISSIVGVVSVLTVAKGLVFAPFISILYNVLYSIISITQSYYGEAIIYIFLMMPVSVISIITWLKNKSKQNDSTVEINKIKIKEYLYLFAATLVLTVCFYFLLKALNTSELIISTLSLISSVVASYLMLRRSSYYAIGFIINDIILILLWGIVTINSGFAYLPTTICFAVFLVNDIYGFVHWKIEEKKQFKKSEDKIINYYINRNYYNLTSDDLVNGVLLDKFPAFQQETEYTCAPACVKMVLSYFGENSFSEKELERECKTRPFPYGTMLKPVDDFFIRQGYETYSSIYTEKDEEGLTFSKYEDFREFVLENLRQGYPIIVENVDYGGHFKVIIGIDILNDDIQQDILIFADPYDSYDGQREGYNYFPAERFFYMWFDDHCIESEYRLQAFIVVKGKKKN